jgi:hypothetical protein
MNGIVVGGGRGEQRPLRRLMRTTRVAGVRSRTLIVLHAAEKGTAQIVDAVGYHPPPCSRCCTGFGPRGKAACGTTARTMGT